MPDTPLPADPPSLPPGDAYRVRAVNTLPASENKIHDDAVARTLGFTAALVPGVDVYAYATHAAVARWGRDWLERGTMDVLLKRPVYEGDEASVLAEAVGDGLHVTVHTGGETCAIAVAHLPASVPPPGLAAFPLAVPPADRPAATAAALPTGQVLGSHPFTVTAAFASQYLHDVQERHPLYAAAGLVHPGTVLRLCNWALAHSVRLGAWIHAGSKVRHFATARVGEELTGRARVLATYERKGHRMVDLDVLVVAAGARAVARVTHTAIYLPRQLAE